MRHLPANVQCLPYIFPSTAEAPWMKETSKNRWKVNLTTWQIGHHASLNFNKVFHRKEDAERYIHNKVWLYKNPTTQATRCLSSKTPTDFGYAQTIRGGTAGLNPILDGFPATPPRSWEAGIGPPIPNPMIKSPRLARLADRRCGSFGSILRRAPGTAPPAIRTIRTNSVLQRPPPPRTAPMTT